VEVEMESSGQWMWAEYDNMTIESEDNNYKLHVTGYHGNAGDAFNDDHKVVWQSNGMMFSTPDVDNDMWSDGNCAGHAGHASQGWWFRRCSTSRLNSITSMWYSTPIGTQYLPTLVTASRMMIQCGAGAI